MARALAGLWQAVDDLGLKLSSKKLLKLINALDEDNSGEIEYREFVKLCSMIREGPHRIVHQSEPCIVTESEYMQRVFRLGSAPVQSVCCGGRLLPPGCLLIGQLPSRRALACMPPRASAPAQAGSSCCRTSWLGSAEECAPWARPGLREKTSITYQHVHSISLSMRVRHGPRPRR